MPEEACAMLCGIFGFIIAVISWYTLVAGDWEIMYVACAFAVIVVLLSAYALIMQHIR